jgi:hypothetical protein
LRAMRPLEPPAATCTGASATGGQPGTRSTACPTAGRSRSASVRGGPSAAAQRRATSPSAPRKPGYARFGAMRRRRPHAAEARTLARGGRLSGRLAPIEPHEEQAPRAPRRHLRRGQKVNGLSVNPVAGIERHPQRSRRDVHAIRGGARQLHFHAAAAAIASVTGGRVRASANTTRSWFEDDGAAAPVDCLRERFRGSCERIGGSDVDVELALRERRGEQA